MFSQIIKPKKNQITLRVPDEYIGKRIIISAVIEEETKTEKQNKYQELRNHFKSIKIDTEKFRFNREEANER